ncbi:hypothetical protein, partial [Adlercreutzia sp. DFI.6.23]|uniref:hypothetical protein n=1 Tax=Adlercreutzia sp. DFI.6.23 TaxID=2963705 RepID=UPI00210A1D17
AEQLSLEEARANKQVWVAESGTLGARLSVRELDSRAFAVGRDGGLAERMEAARNGVSEELHALGGYRIADGQGRVVVGAFQVVVGVRVQVLGVAVVLA